MELSNHIILIAALLGFVSILGSVVATRVGLPLLLVFLALGMLAGEDGPGGIDYDNILSAQLIGSLALAVILFDGGLRTPFSSFRVGLKPALLLATIGVAVTAGITGLIASWALDLPWMEGLLIGAIVGSTDAAAVFSVLHGRGLAINERTAATLEIESGSNDPMAIFLTLVLTGYLTGEMSSEWWTLPEAFAMQIGLGGVGGVLGGLVLIGGLRWLALPVSLRPLFALAGGLTVFGITASAGGSGFLAVYLAGLLLGNRKTRGISDIQRFHDGIAWLSQIALFLMLGLLVTPHLLLEVALPALLIALTLIFVARPLAVWLCLLPFGFPRKEKLFISWVGLRGAVPIVLALFPWLAGVENAALYFYVAFFVVLVSLVVQGWTVAPAAHRLGLMLPSKQNRVTSMDLELLDHPGHSIAVYGVGPDSGLLGRQAGTIRWPAGAEIAGVIRDHHVQADAATLVLAAGDILLFLCQQAHIAELDRLLDSASSRRERAEQAFYGSFVLDGQALLGDIAKLYSSPIDDAVASMTLDEAFHHTVQRHPVVGDTLRLGSLTLVVREMKGDRVTKVGLKLTP